VEALKIELQSFLECISQNKVIANDGRAGLQVVRMLEAASSSVAKRGELVYL